MVIRIVEGKDVAALVELIQKDLGDDDAKEDFVRSQILKLDTNRDAVFVAEIDESVVGFIHVEKYSNIYRDFLSISSSCFFIFSSNLSAFSNSICRFFSLFGR